MKDKVVSLPTKVKNVEFICVRCKKPIEEGLIVAMLRNTKPPESGWTKLLYCRRPECPNYMLLQIGLGREI